MMMQSKMPKTVFRSNSMKTVVLPWIPVFVLALLLVSAGCSSQDGGVTEPLPNVTPQGDFYVKPDSTNSMDPLTQAVASAQPGNVIVVFPGAYNGTLVLDKPLHFVTSAGKENTILTGSTDSTTVRVQITSSFGAADSLILEGFGLNSAGRGMLIETSTVPVVLRKCDVFDNAGVGIQQMGAGPAKAPGAAPLVLWRCFFRRNGLSPVAGSLPPATAGLWCMGSLSASSVFFEDNQIGLALSDAAVGAVDRTGIFGSVDAGLWLESGSNLVLSGEGLSNVPEIRDGSGWGVVVDNSRLELRSYNIMRNQLGGMKVTGSTINLDTVDLEGNLRYGIWSTDSVDSLNSCTILNTKRDATYNTHGFGLFAQGIGTSRLAYLSSCEISESFRNGIIVDGLGMKVELSGCLLAGNGMAWSTSVYTIDDPEEPVGAGLSIRQGAASALSSDTEITKNVGVRGGGVAVLDDGSTLEIDGGNIHENVAVESGGGMFVRAGSVALANLQVEANECLIYGGGIAIVQSGSVDATGTTVANNSADRRGGGAFIYEGHGSFQQNCSFVGNSSDNEVEGKGGGIYFDESDLQLGNVTFDSNVGIIGGALHAVNLVGDVLVSQCTFINNQARNAAAIYARDLTRTLRVEECIMAKNSLSAPSLTLPSAVYNREDLPGGALELVGCTIVVNQGGAAAIANRSGDMTITESVVAQNSPAGLTGSDLSFVEMSCNDFWSNSEMDYGPGANPGPGSISEDPQFCDPQNLVFTVNSTSPLLPGNNSCAVQIGALGQGCSITP
jgi:hypothetical protein